MINCHYSHKKNYILHFVQMQTLQSFNSGVQWFSPCKNHPWTCRDVIQGLKDSPTTRSLFVILLKKIINSFWKCCTLSRLHGRIMPNSQLRFGDVSDRGLKCHRSPLTVRSPCTPTRCGPRVPCRPPRAMGIPCFSLHLVVLWTDGILPGNSLLCQTHARGQCANRALLKCVPAGKTSHLTGEQEA